MFAKKKTVWLVATGVLVPYSAEAKALVEYVKNLPGFIATHPHDKGMLWIFDSKENAQSAKAGLTEFGVKPGTNICRGSYAKNCVNIECVDN